MTRNHAIRSAGIPTILNGLMLALFWLITAIAIARHLESYLLFFWIPFFLAWLLILALRALMRVVLPTRKAADLGGGQPKPRRKTFQFGLRAIVLQVASISILVGCVAWRRHEAVERDKFLDYLAEKEAIGGITTSRTFESSTFFGYYEVEQLELRVGWHTADDVRTLRSLFPETEISIKEVSQN